MRISDWSSDVCSSDLHIGSGIYGGVWVGAESPIPNTHGLRNDVLAALRRLKVPLVRWPGGCFADPYHWRDGIGPREDRPARVNSTWGGVNDSHACGPPAFMAFVWSIAGEAYVNRTEVGWGIRRYVRCDSGGRRTINQ